MSTLELGLPLLEVNLSLRQVVPGPMDKRATSVLLAVKIGCCRGTLSQSLYEVQSFL